jgi:hypothetical protein
MGGLKRWYGLNDPKEKSMTVKSLTLFAAVAMLAAAPTLGYAQNSQAPGQMMQEKGSVKGDAGASGYTPGHQMQEKGSVKGTTGASGYAPGHATTGSGVKSDVDVNANTRGAVKGGADIDAGAKIDKR